MTPGEVHVETRAEQTTVEWVATTLDTARALIAAGSLATTDRIESDRQVWAILSKGDGVEIVRARYA